MSQPLEEVFRELGISQYLGVFLDQGFDTWETILDITESDLDALNVKLGHRRKLQRRIANSRGVAPGAALVSPPAPSTDDVNSEAQRPETSSGENRDVPPPVVQKRKYRRHPKPDENAPERPPSAYVLFSNKMRDDLKGQMLTFTEIAKLVGENWQALSQAEKEAFETQAQTNKDKYNQELAEYKKTTEFKKYTQYLQDFKAKHAKHTQDKDASKRMRLSDGNGVDKHSPLTRERRSGTAGSQSGSEPPPTRQLMLGSVVSNGDFQPKPSTIAQLTPADDAINLPGASYFDRRPSENSPLSNTSPIEASSRVPRQPSRQNPTWADGARAEASIPSRHLPSLSDVLDGQSSLNGVRQVSDIGGLASFSRNGPSGSPGSVQSTKGSTTKPPSLKKEASSAGSLSSGNSKPVPLYEATQLPTPDDKSPFPFAHEKVPNEQVTGGYPLPHINGLYSGLAPIPGQQGPAPSSNGENGSHFGVIRGAPHGSAVNVQPDVDLDGMSALLRAGEIVNRRAN